MLSHRFAKWLLVSITATLAWAFIGPTALCAEPGDVVIRIVMVEDEDEEPAAAGKAAAEALLKAMGDTALKAVLVSECFEDLEYKESLIEGVCSVLPAEMVMGGATYGSFTQAGCSDFDSVCLLGIGGRGVGVSARLVTDMGTAKLTFDTDQDQIREKLHAAGEKLAGKLRRTDNDKLLILVADAHSPKNQFLVEGVQKVLGKQFPITGGCANKNAGQTFVYFKGKAHADSAVALMLSGDFQVALSGRMANQNDTVIASAEEGAAEALKKLKGKPIAALAFNCAGRRSKLNDYQDELDAMRKAIGDDLPLFGCYCAGEIGPVDNDQEKSDALSGGSGWHLMFTLIGKK
ncbi:MAG: FIST C-terminal domain-containing protein [Planctomycetes bacterium]|nr:FIST C-terminal domain-containing protein [Planctomycetota bacterium]